MTGLTIILSCPRATLLILIFIKNMQADHALADDGQPRQFVMRFRVPLSTFFALISVQTLWLTPTAYPQRILYSEEDSLRKLAVIIQKGPDDFIRFDASRSFLAYLTELLVKDPEMNYPFDSLSSISKLASPDRHIRIFTWVIRKNDGSCDYSGLLQIRTEGKICRLLPLEDHSQDIESPDKQNLTTDNWYGALYYKLIQKQYGTKTYYTLLGWDGHDALSHRKLIEVLTFQGKGKPVFGSLVFSRYPGKVKRVIFEYSARSSMTLNFSRQRYFLPVKKGSKRKMKEYEDEIIVFDRLTPMNEALTGQYQYYLPESNLQDGFYFDKGKWNFIKEVDARNLPEEKNEKTRKSPELELFPPPGEPKK